MKLKFALPLCLGAALFGRTPYYTDPLTSIDPAKWHQNGVLEASPYGLISFDPNGGSLISTVAVPDGSSQYEVTSSLVTCGSGTYVHYLSASQDALSGPSPSGSYYAVELELTSGYANYCPGVLSVYKRWNGIVSLLASTPVTFYPHWAYGYQFADLMRSVRASQTILVYAAGILRFAITDTEIPGGQPGLGVRYTYNGVGVSQVSFYPADRVAPSPVVASSIASSPLPNSVDLQWQGAADDPEGYGILRYDVYRNGSPMGSFSRCEVTDAAASPSTTYTYTIYAVDYFLNSSTGTSVSVATPSANRIDPRRVGVRPTASYWGGAGERIDTRTGNLNFTLPVVNAKGRGGWSVTFALSYNSQLWRKDATATWKLGRDVGYGFGWRLQAGSVTTYWSDPWTIHHYLFIDSTGAEYRLDVNTSGIWTSREAIYVEYDAANRKLYFPDGSFWLMGAVSSGIEQDAGSRYPTLMQDTNGNQILIRYHQGQGSAWADSSARIKEIEDARAGAQGPGGPPPRSFTFTYNGDPVPHLTTIADCVGVGAGHTFTYLPVSLYSPFSPPVAFGSTHLLQSAYRTAAYWQHTFEYSGTAGELTKVTLPFGGSIGWAHRQFTYVNNRTFREVQYRYLRPSAGASELTYEFVHDDAGDASRSLHSWTRLLDPSGHATVWDFQTATTPSYSIGLQTILRIRPSATGNSIRRHNYTWSADAAGNPCVSSMLTTLDDSQSYVKQSKTEQTIDTHGNVTQVKVYDYGNLTTPARTYNHAYLGGTDYAARHIWNRLVSSDVTHGTVSLPLVRNWYDDFWPEGYLTPPGTPTQWVWPATHPLRGNVSSSWVPGKGLNYRYYSTGDLAKLNRDGLEVSVTPDATRNYALPAALTPNSETNLTTSLTYTGAWDPSTITAPNGATGSFSYDPIGRPASVTSPHGAVTTYSYTTSPPTVTVSLSGRWTRTTMDGLGRPIKAETGDGSATKSIVDTEYTACACSPFGKVWRTSQPYAPGGTVYWTTNTYDCLGRTTTVALPGGTGSTTYLYQGNTIKVTDPAGKWKKSTYDAMGNLIQVTEPNPAGGANHETYYTYNLANRLTQVSMPRGSFTQTRTFAYDNDQQLTSATNPENGAVTYVYNGDHTLQKKTDAKNQRLEYTYDAYKRVTQIRKFNSAGQEDTAARVDFTYDQNPFEQNYSENAWGRPTTAQYRNGDFTLTEMFSYTQSGLPTKKKLRVAHAVHGPIDLEGLWAYDNEGRFTTLTWPLGGRTESYTYDSMGRPSALGGVASGATYGPAGELTGMSWQGFTETRAYNARYQLIRQTVSDQDLEYRYSPTQNNGQITHKKNWISGAEVSYQYDALNRLIAAATTGPEWGQAYTYDGFGNRTAVTVTKGTAPSGTLTIDPMTNRITSSGFSYDANGNLTAMPGLALYYDYDNRLLLAGTVSDPGYGYDAQNRRVMKGLLWGAYQGTADVYFIGVDGRRMGTYQVSWGQWIQGLPQPMTVQRISEDVHFGGRLVISQNQRVVTDRLGSVIKNDNEQLLYLPFGDERTTTTQNRHKYATYYRDSTGLDYAQNRYYSSSHGRFLTPDPWSGSAALSNPQSWNRYAYADNSPVNNIDATGLAVCGVQYGYEDCLTSTGPGSPDSEPIQWCWDMINTFGLGASAFGYLSTTTLCGPLMIPGAPLLMAALSAGQTEEEEEKLIPDRVIATYDCVGPDPLALFGGAVLRQVTYEAYAGGTRLPVDSQAVISEELVKIYGPLPDKSQSAPGAPFYDQIGTRNKGDFKLEQQFFVTVRGEKYNVQVQGFRDKTLRWQNTIKATNKQVLINEDAGAPCP